MPAASSPRSADEPSSVAEPAGAATPQYTSDPSTGPGGLPFRPPYVQWKRPSRVKRPPGVLTLQEIADRYGVHRNTVRKKAKLHDFVLRTFGVRGGRAQCLREAEARRLAERMHWQAVPPPAPADPS